MARAAQCFLDFTLRADAAFVVDSASYAGFAWLVHSLECRNPLPGCALRMAQVGAMRRAVQPGHAK